MSPAEIAALVPGAVADPDGTIAFRGYTVPAGPAQYGDLMRILNGDPKADYLILARGGSVPS